MTSGLSAALSSSSSTAAPANEGLGPWAAIPAIFSSVAGAMSSFSANSAQNSQAQMELQQAQIQRDEEYFKANQKQREVDRFQKEQIMQFASSGVLVSGSPLAVLADTALQGKQEVDAMRRRGDALYKLGVMKADNANSTGRNSLLSGLFGSMSGGLSNFLKGKQLGLFSSSNTSSTSPAVLSAIHSHGSK